METMVAAAGKAMGAGRARETVADEATEMATEMGAEAAKELVPELALTPARSRRRPQGALRRTSAASVLSAKPSRAHGHLFQSFVFNFDHVLTRTHARAMLGQAPCPSTFSVGSRAALGFLCTALGSACAFGGASRWCGPRTAPPVGPEGLLGELRGRGGVAAAALETTNMDGEISGLGEIRSQIRGQQRYEPHPRCAVRALL